MRNVSGDLEKQNIKGGVGEVEEYIDLVPILENLYYDVDKFLEPIKEVRIEYAS